MNLYKLNKEFEEAIYNISQLDCDLFLDETTGEVISEDVYADMLNAIDIARDEKLKNCLYYIRSLESDEDVIAKEIKRLQSLKATKTNAIARFKDYVLANVDKGEKLDFQTIKLSCVAGIESVQIDVNAQVPQEYCTLKVTPNKAELKKALKRGIDIDGVLIVKPEKRLIIK
jgi:ribosome-associated translation inhibitor RaiA